MWLPFGLLVVGLLARLPEPERGGQDFDFHLEAKSGVEADGVSGVLPNLDLPAPRTSTLHYDEASWTDVLRELLKRHCCIS